MSALKPPDNKENNPQSDNEGNDDSLPSTRRMPGLSSLSRKNQGEKNQENKLSKNKKPNLWAVASLQASLIVFGITTAILNTIPYLEFAQSMWFSAADKTQIGSFNTVASVLWLFSGLSIWSGLQLLEMLPSIKLPISKGLQNQIRFVGYGLDIALLNSVYPVLEIPPNIENILLMFFALFAVEFALWLYDRLSPINK